MKEEGEKKLEIEIEGEDLGIDFRAPFELYEDVIRVDVYLHLTLTVKEFVNLVRKVELAEEWKLKLLSKE